MTHSRALVRLLMSHQGEKYVLGALAPKENPSYRGPWDCAEFVAWGIYQVSHRYVGVRGRKHDAWTGFFAEDLPRVATRVEEWQAVAEPGVIALRTKTTQRIGHIAVSRGNGLTIEAADGRHGVTSLHIPNRGFTEFYRLNFLIYDNVCTFI